MKRIQWTTTARSLVPLSLGLCLLAGPAAARHADKDRDRDDNRGAWGSQYNGNQRDSDRSYKEWRKDQRKDQKERDKAERKYQKEQEKAWKHNRDRDGDRDDRDDNGNSRYRRSQYPGRWNGANGRTSSYRQRTPANTYSWRSRNNQRNQYNQSNRYGQYNRASRYHRTRTAG